MEYRKIDVAAWERGEVFHRFIDEMRCVMSMTADIDVTGLLAFVRENGLKLYPVMMWAVSKVINAHAEFKYGWHADGSLILWDSVSPYYADFHREDEACVKLVTEYSESLAEFYTRFLRDRERYAALRAFELCEVPKNTFDVSCLPWVRYKSFNMHVFDSGTYLAPVVTWGKFEVENGRAVMPLSMNIHHAVADGFHLCRFFTEVQEIANNIKAL